MDRPLLHSERQRLAAAVLTGAIENMASAGGEWLLDDAVAVIHQASRDPQVIGDTLGCYLVHAETEPVYAAVVQILRAAGADEHVAARVAEWQRERLARDTTYGGPRT